MNQMAETQPDKQHSRTYVYFIAAIAALGGFNWGFNIILMSGAILFLKNHFQIAALSLDILGIQISSAWIEGFTMTSGIYGTTAGMVLGGLVADRIGRKRMLFASGLLLLASSIGTTFSESLVIWNISRLVGGLGAGFSGLVAPTYISEIAPAHRRGSLVTLNQFAVVVGAFAANLTTYLIAKHWGADPECWRWMFASAVLPITVFLIGLFVIPESPRWLILKNRIEDARAILTRIGGAERTDQTIQEIVQGTGQEKVKFRELFRPGIRKATLLVCGLALFNHFVGVSTLIYYAPTLFVNAGISSQASAIGNSVILRIGDMLWTFLVIACVDKFGRRPLLLTGLIGIAIGQFLMGTCFHLSLSPLLILLVFFLVEGMFHIGVPPVTWLITTEVFPTRYRARGVALQGFVRLGTQLFLAQTFPPAIQFFKSRFGTEAGVFWVFAAIAVVGLVFSYYLTPETKGKTLEEISAKYTPPDPAKKA